MKKQWYWISLVVIILGLVFKQPLLLVISVLGLLVLLTADIWARYCLQDLRFQRELGEQRVLFGEETTLSLTIENAKLLPLPWLEIEDVVPNAIVVQGRQLRIDTRINRTILENLFSPRWYERVTRRYTVICKQRGIHTFGPTSLRSGDLFGFTERSATVENRQFLIVYPLVVPLTSFNLPARYPFGDRRAPRRLFEDPSRVIGVRDYMHGDDLRRVHWKATARAQELQSKIYEPTTTYDLVLFLNVEHRLDAHYSTHPELQELAICAAASIADWGLNTGYSVGLYANSIMYMPELGMSSPTKPSAKQEDEEQDAFLEQALLKHFRQKRVHIPPASNEEQRKRIMEVLARVQPYFGQTIEDMIQQERPHLPVGATVVVITSSVSDPLLDSLTHLKRAGHAITLLLVGDQPIGQLAGIPVRHLGGEETWNRLSGGYAVAQDKDNLSAPKPQETMTVGFNP